MDEIGGLQYEIKSLRSFADGTALENKNIKASNKKVHEDNEKLKAQQKSAKIMNETLDELIKEKIDELQEENSKLKAEVSNFKKGESWLKLSLKEAREEIYEKDPETGENTDVKSLDIQSQKLSDIYEIFEDETKGYCLYHGECGFKDFLCILQKSRDNAEAAVMHGWSEEEEELMCEACGVGSGLFVHSRGNVCLCESCGKNHCVGTSEEDNCDRCRKE